jgi:hypothetical protein
MFTDDAAYIISSQQELEMLCAAMFHHMHHFGLLMHAGTLDENGNHQTKSKMEAMFIPAHPMMTEITQPCIHMCNGLFICQLYLLPELLEEMDSKEDTPLPFASFVSLSQLIIVI